MIEEIRGDLLDFPEGITVIMHQANCRHTMGAGIAKQIKDRYPTAYKADRSTVYGNQKMGTFSYSFIGKNCQRVIFNLYGQDGFGRTIRSTNYEALYLAIDNAFKMIKRFSLYHYKVGIPKFMGCGLAGGDWRIVRAMVESLSEQYNLTVVIVEWKQ
jgi:O-acetyl-ADP-ribose deacetylase (regulator of RNase III)